MAVLKVRNSKAKPSKIINYVVHREKTEDKLISGLNCTPENVKDQFELTKNTYKKNKGVQYHHYMQSYKPGEVAPEKAHELGMELAEKIASDKFECLVVTHIDENLRHAHS